MKKPYTKEELAAIPARKRLDDGEFMLFLGSVYEMLGDTISPVTYSEIGRISQVIMSNKGNVCLGSGSSLLMRKLKGNKALFDIVKPFIYKYKRIDFCRCGHGISTHMKNNYAPPLQWQERVDGCRVGRCVCAGINYEDLRF